MLTPHGLHVWLVAMCIMLSGHVSVAAPVTYHDEIGYTLLQSALGPSIPDGAGVRVTQVEAESNNAFQPDPAAFPGKTITHRDGGPIVTGPYSSHAGSVGGNFYGQVSLASGVTDIASYSVDDWLQSGFLGAYTAADRPNASSHRVSNHSWIGETGIADADAEILRRLDWLVEEDEFIHVVAYTGNQTKALVNSGFNVIAVQRSGDASPAGSAGVVGDPVYTTGHPRPDIMVPADTNSNSVPRVASAAALLVGMGHAMPGLSGDPEAVSTTNRNGDTIYNAERSEVIKAVLMAGANRITSNVTDGDVVDYRAAPGDQTANGLDRRYGSGQLNIYNSYQMIASAEQNSEEDGQDGFIGAYGFDYDPAFGGTAGSNSIASYYFSTLAGETEFAAALVWNVAIDATSKITSSSAVTLYDLDLYLYDTTDSENWVLVGVSDSGTENTENIWLEDLAQNTSYAIQVKRGQAQGPFSGDYGLAWRAAPPDLDKDGVPDSADEFPSDPSESADTDNDGVGDNGDNCQWVVNDDQRDTNGDGYGNACDPDLDNDELVTISDFLILRGVMNTTDEDADLNGDGLVSVTDFLILRNYLNQAPGPSGLAP